VWSPRRQPPPRLVLLCQQRPQCQQRKAAPHPAQPLSAR
jgi:hypothetical protein